MTIDVNDAIIKVGSQGNLDNTSGSVANGAFSIAADFLTITNSDDALGSGLVLEVTIPVAANANSSIPVHLQQLNIDDLGNDEPVPSADYQGALKGSFPVNTQTTIQRIPLDIVFPRLKSGAEYQPFIENNTGQTISAGMVMFETDSTVGPKAA